MIQRIPRPRMASWCMATVLAVILLAPLLSAQSATAQTFNYLSLNADGRSSEAVFVGATATLNAQNSYDVGPTPYYIEIFDTTTGSRVAVCGSGTACSVGVSHSVATTHTYVADVAGWSASYPPPSIQSASVAVTVTWAAPIILNGGQAYANGPGNFTAHTTYDVGPTPYFIEIFDVATGARVAVCGSGTSCSGSVSWQYGTHTYVADIASYSTSYPPPDVQAASNAVTVQYVYIN